MHVIGCLIDWDKAVKLNAEGNLQGTPLDDYTVQFDLYKEDGWRSDSAGLYQMIGMAYAKLREGLSERSRPMADTVMDLFCWRDESMPRFRDLDTDDFSLHLLWLSPETVRRVLWRAAEVDWQEFRTAYERLVPLDEQDELAPYDLNVDAYIRKQWLGSLQKAADRGMGFGVYAG